MPRLPISLHICPYLAVSHLALEKLERSAGPPVDTKVTLSTQSHVAAGGGGVAAADDGGHARLGRLDAIASIAALVGEGKGR